MRIRTSDELGWKVKVVIEEKTNVFFCRKNLETRATVVPDESRTLARVKG